MIKVTRLNHSSLLLNSDLIETIETTPDTTITLVNGHKLMVLESEDDIQERIIQFRKAIVGRVADHRVGVSRIPYAVIDPARSADEHGYE